MQTVFHYDYGSEKYAIKQAKRLRSQSVYVWVVRNPKDGRYKVLEGECYADRPTRVPILWEHYTPPPKPRDIDQRTMDRDNLVWAAHSAENSDDPQTSELARAILDYLEQYNA